MFIVLCYCVWPAYLCKSFIDVPLIWHSVALSFWHDFYVFTTGVFLWDDRNHGLSGGEVEKCGSVNEGWPCHRTDIAWGTPWCEVIRWSDSTWLSTAFGASICDIIRNNYNSLYAMYTPRNDLGGVYWIHPVCLSVCLSVCSLTFCVRPVAFTVQDGFFSYLVQMITSMTGCVACDDPWSWPISSRSFGLDLENRVCSVASTVLNGFFLYVAQMITVIGGCVACYVFSESGDLNFWQFLKTLTLTFKKKFTILHGFFPYLAQMITSMTGFVAYSDLWPWLISSRSFGHGLENCVRSVASTVPDGVFPYLVQMITSMRRCVTCNDLWPWPIFSRSFGLDLENCVRSVASTVLDGFFSYLVQMITSMRRCVACHDLWPSRSFDFVLIWGIQHDSIVWVIMRRRGVSSERTRSSCSSFFRKHEMCFYQFLTLICDWSLKCFIMNPYVVDTIENRFNLKTYQIFVYCHEIC